MRRRGSLVLGAILLVAGLAAAGPAPARPIGFIDHVTPSTPTPATPNLHSSPLDIVVGPDGALWFTETFTPDLATIPMRIGRVSTGGQVQEFGLPPSYGFTRPAYITPGPDGNLWFTGSVGSTLGRITLAGQVLPPIFLPQVFDDPVLSFPPLDPRPIVLHPDGRLFILDIGRQFIFPGQPGGIARLWRVTLDALGNVSELVSFPVPLRPSDGSVNPVSLDEGITVGPDGLVYFTLSQGRRIGRIAPGAVPGDPAAIEQFDLPAGTGAPLDIIVGPDGNLWFAGTTGLGRFLPPPSGATAVAVTFFRFPSFKRSAISDRPGAGLAGRPCTAGPRADAARAASGPGPAAPGPACRSRLPDPRQPIEDGPPLIGGAFSLAAGPDGAVWFTLLFDDAVGRVTLDGEFSFFPMPRGDTAPYGITTGPDGQLWVAGLNSDRIVQSQPLVISPGTGTFFGTERFDFVAAHALPGFSPILATAEVRVNGLSSLVTPGGVVPLLDFVAGCISAADALGALAGGGATGRCPGVPVGAAGPGTFVIEVLIDFTDGAVVVPSRAYVEWTVLGAVEPGLGTAGSLGLAAAHSPPSSVLFTTQRLDMGLALLNTPGVDRNGSGTVTAADALVSALIRTSGPFGAVYFDGERPGIPGGTSKIGTVDEGAVDVLRPLQACLDVFPGTLTGLAGVADGGRTFRCPDVPVGSALGPGWHLYFPAALLPTGSGGRVVFWQVFQNFE